jgi:hypothetical protein
MVNADGVGIAKRMRYCALLLGWLNQISLCSFLPILRNLSSTPLIRVPDFCFQMSPYQIPISTLPKLKAKSLAKTLKRTVHCRGYLLQRHSILLPPHPRFLHTLTQIFSPPFSLSNMPRFIQSFTTIPRQLFRLNNGKIIRLRGHPGPLRPQGRFDLLTEAGKVQPKALNPQTYEG